MENEVCKIGNFGFGKFKEGCKKKHLKQVCENLPRCVDIKACPKKHPKTCRSFMSGKDADSRRSVPISTLGAIQMRIKMFKE